MSKKKPQNKRRKQRRGKHFEKATKKVFQHLMPDKAVLTNVEVKGIITGGSREIDVQVLEDNGIDFLAIECKDEKSPIGTPTVEGWYGKLRELGATNSAIVSNSGFNRPARRYAEQSGISLYNLVDSSDPKVKFHLTFKIFFQQSYVADLAIEYPRGVGLEDNIDIGDMLECSINAKDIKATKLYYAVRDLWNKSKVTENEQARTAEVIIDEPTLTRNGKEVNVPWLKVKYRTDLKYYVGKQDVYDTKGIYDVVNESYTTNSMAIGDWKPEEIGTDKFPEVSKSDFEKGSYTIGLTLRANMNDEPVRGDPAPITP